MSGKTDPWGRSGNTSRCSAAVKGQLPEGAPIFTWRDHIDGNRACVQEYDDFVAKLPPVPRAAAKANLKVLMNRAAQGRLWQADDDSTEIKPVRKDPELYELRWKILTIHARMYHAEPEVAPAELWALNRHLKGAYSEGGSEWHSQAHQQAEIDHSAARYAAILAGHSPDA